MFCISAAFRMIHSVSCLLLPTEPPLILSFLGDPLWPQPFWGDTLLWNMAADRHARGGQDFKPRPSVLQTRARQSGKPGYAAEQLLRDETCVRLTLFFWIIDCVCGCVWVWFFILSFRVNTYYIPKRSLIKWISRMWFQQAYLKRHFDPISVVTVRWNGMKSATASQQLSWRS